MYFLCPIYYVMLIRGYHKQFWVAYTSCDSSNKDSVPQTIEQIDAIRRFAQDYPDDLQFAESAAGKKILLNFLN